MTVSRYRGSEPTNSVDQVVRYLVQNYTTADGQPLTEAVARAMCKSGMDKIDSARRLTSFVYYAGDQVIADQDVLWIDDDDDYGLEDEDEDEED